MITMDTVMKNKEYGPFSIVDQEAGGMTIGAASPKRKAPDVRVDLKTSTPARRVTMGSKARFQQNGAFGPPIPRPCVIKRSITNILKINNHSIDHSINP